MSTVRLIDYFIYALTVFVRHKMRTALLLLALSMGVASVIILTTIGEGARHFIHQEFSAMGSDLLIILPGKKETQGGAPPIYGASPRDLTIDDVNALKTINSIDQIAPIIAGTALIRFGNKSREVITMGSTTPFFALRNMRLGEGRLLPDNADSHHSPVIILGSKVKQELFGAENALGEWLNVGDFRFRVIGVLEERGESLGLDLRDMAVIGVRSAEMVFDSPALFRVILKLKYAGSEHYTEQQVRSIIASRHEGEDDVTFISQDAMMSAFDNVMLMVTMVLGAIAAISLIVAGVLIMNVTYISVAQRKHEIGLLKAIGATAKQVKTIFVIEALILAIIGSAFGLLGAIALIELATTIWSNFYLAAPFWAIFAACSTALVVSLLFSLVPAKKAAQLDPIIALRSK